MRIKNYALVAALACTAALAGCSNEDTAKTTTPASTTPAATTEADKPADTTTAEPVTEAPATDAPVTDAPTEEPDTDAPAAEFDLSASTFHGFIGFQTNNYSFRNEVDEDNYGYHGAKNDEYFTVHAWASENNLVSAPGELHDVNITGDGTYTVSVTGLDWKAVEEQYERPEFADGTQYNLIFVSTDIPWDAYKESNGEVDITIDELKIGGNVIAFDKDAVAKNFAKGYDDIPFEDELTTGMAVVLQNNWVAAVKTLPAYDVYASDIEITFTVTGLDSYTGTASLQY